MSSSTPRRALQIQNIYPPSCTKGLMQLDDELMCDVIFLRIQLLPQRYTYFATFLCAPQYLEPLKIKSKLIVLAQYFCELLTCQQDTRAPQTLPLAVFATSLYLYKSLYYTQTALVPIVCRLSQALTSVHWTAAIERDSMLARVAQPWPLAFRYIFHCTVQQTQSRFRVIYLERSVDCTRVGKGGD